jgi:hypothetical protein
MRETGSNMKHQETGVNCALRNFITCALTEYQHNRQIKENGIITGK